MQPSHPGYAVIVALRKGAGIEIEQHDYASEQQNIAWAAYRTFQALCENGGALSVTLEGPNDIVLAEWEA